MGEGSQALKNGYGYPLCQGTPFLYTVSVMRLDYRRALSLCGGMALILLVAACGGRESDVPLDVQAQAINQRLMCPVCPSETIDQSQVQLAQQMRTIVQEKLVAGESREEIFQFFVERYGESVLASPPRRGFNLLVWLVPPVALIVGGGVLYAVLRTMRRQSAGSTGVGASIEMLHDDTLEPYLQSVDEEMRPFLEAGHSADSNRPLESPSSGIQEQARS